MSKESKIYIFRDRKDYILKITDEKIYNITGEKGSGKSFFGNMKDNDDNCTVIHLDPIFTPEGSKPHESSYKVREILTKKFGNNLNPSLYFEKKYHNVLVEFLRKEKKEGYIEGGSISEVENISNIVGTVVVKRTGILKCFIRVLKRDYHNEYFMKISIEKYGKLGKIHRFFDVYKRRKKMFKSYHNIEKFIEKLENYKKNEQKNI